MEKQQKNQSAAIAVLILLLTAVTLAACFGLIYAYGQIALLQAELAEKDEEIAQIQADYEAEKQALKNLFEHLHSYVVLLEVHYDVLAKYINSELPELSDSDLRTTIRKWRFYEFSPDSKSPDRYMVKYAATFTPNKDFLIFEMHKILGDDREYDCESIKDFYLQYFY